MIAFDRTSLSYAGRPAVREVTLRADEGEVLALLGPSGCGKTTLLRLALGLVAPDSGEVRVGGHAVTDRSAPAIRRDCGYVVQDGGLFPHLTNRANVELMARRLRWDADRRNARIAELARLVRFPEEGLDRYPRELSGGQRGRVGVMRALMLGPRIVLMDEPLAALDPLVRAALQDDLKRVFAETGATVLLVTHDMGEAAYLAHRIALMREGRVVQVGTPAELRDAPAEPFVSEFLLAQRGWAA